MYVFAVTPAVTQIRRRGVEISEVVFGSLAAELELEPGVNTHGGRLTYEAVAVAQEREYTSLDDLIGSSNARTA